MKQKLSLLLILALAVVSLSACSSPPKNEQLTVTGMYFDTIVRIDVWGAEPSALEHCKELCESYENLFSSTIETSEISQINTAGGVPVTVSDETVALIEKGLYFSELSGGKFDITIASLSDLWTFKDNTEGTLPDNAALEDAKKHVNYETVRIEGNTVTLTDPESKLDLGGIAKGYIADQLKNYLLEEGIEHALINLGGNVLTIGGKYDGTPFEIGIQKPFDDRGQAITSVKVKDCSIVSSGIYERYFERDGNIYHHILDPATGYPVENDLLQVTILSDSSADGDALSTCCFALGLEEGRKLVESLDGIEAIFITKDYELHYAGEDLSE